MIHIGLDVHKRKTKVAVLDDKTGEIHKPYDVRTGELLDHIKQMPGPKRIAMETSTVSQFVARQMVSCGLDVMVVAAFKCHRLLTALSRSKTDKLDAMGLSLLLAKGMFETARVWLPSHEAHKLREWSQCPREGLYRAVRPTCHPAGTALLQRQTTQSQSDLTAPQFPP